jgi:hypothetical protein
MSKITQDSGVDKIQEPKEQIRFITQFFENVKQLINNGLSFADNFNTKILTLTFSATNTDTALVHGLGRAPVGYLILRRSANMVVYGATANTSSIIYLKSSAAGTVTVSVF